MKLNLGCGYKHLHGWLNVDMAPEVKPDQLLDLDETPWPWLDESADEIRMCHVLEHLGETKQGFVNIVREAYRVLKPGGLWRVVFPDVNHDNWHSDPTHVRPITPRLLLLLSQRMNKEWIASRNANTAYGIHIGVNFEIVEDETAMVIDRVRWPDLMPDNPTPEQMQVAIDAAYRYLNVVEEWRMALRKEPLLA